MKPSTPNNQNAISRFEETDPRMPFCTASKRMKLQLSLSK